MSTKDAFRQHLIGGDLEGALQLIEAHLPGVSGSATRKNYLSGARALFRWAHDEWRSLLHPDADFGESYLAYLTQKHGAETGSIQNRLNHARTAYKALIAADILTTNPFEGVKGPNHRAEDHREGYTTEEIERLIQHASPEGRAFVLLGAHAGLTGRELLTLEWPHVNLGAGALDVNGRTVPLSKELQAALRAYHTTLFPGAIRVFDLPDQAALRERLFALCQRAQVWYGARGFRALRAHAGERFYTLHEDRELVARLLGLHGVKTQFTVRNYTKRKAQQSEVDIP